MKLKKVMKRIVAMFVAVLMVFTLVPASNVRKAIAADVPEILLKINGESALNANNLKVAYGEELTFSLSGKDLTGYDLTFYYTDELDSDEPTWEPFEVDEDSKAVCMLKPGEYLLTYDAICDDDYQTDSDKNFSFTVEKATLSTPVGYKWVNNSIRWDAVTKTTKGFTFPSDVVSGYVVSVYKNGTFVENVTISGATQYNNISNKFAGDANYKNGKYTFKVTAKASDAYADYYIDSATSGMSGSITVALITAEAGKGVLNVSPEDPFLILPGDTEHTYTIKANLKDDYRFGAWSGEGVVFADATSPETTVSIPADFSGNISVTIVATAMDDKAPVVSDPVRVDATTISGTASDAEEGIAAYAFSTETSLSKESGAWIGVTEPAAGSKTFLFDLMSIEGGNDCGAIYFYAMDKDGNITRSENPIRVTKIQLNDYYENNAFTSKTVYFIGDTNPTLPSTERLGYRFDGWYFDSSYENAANAFTHEADSVIVHAKWIADELNTVVLSGYTGAYDGTSHTLTAIYDDSAITGSLQFSWYKDGTLIAGADSASYSIKDVDDSGAYVVKISVLDADENVVSETNSAEASISITPVSITVSTVTDILVGEDAPETFPLTITEGSLVGSDKLSDFVSFDSANLISFDKNVAGDYTVELTVNALTNNYTVNTADGTLTVKPIDGTVSVTLEQDSFVYDGTVKKPGVTVTVSGVEIDPAFYDVTYYNEENDDTCINAGTYTVKVVLKGNYKGEDTVQYVIEKANFTPSVIMSGWKYGETKVVPVLQQYNNDITASDVTYYYALKGSADYTTDVPKDAGEYVVYAYIPETENYLASDSKANPSAFEITKRTIVISSESETFNFDGLPHSNAGYTIETDDERHDGFAPGTGEGFLSVSVVGEVTSVTPDDVAKNNKIEYILNSATLAKNYDFILEEGTLKVVPRQLTAPSEAKWDTTKPGTVSWVAVARKDLTVAYNVSLYAYDGNDYTLIPVNGNDSVLVKTGTSINFAEEIRKFASDAAENGETYSYVFRIASIPLSGSEAGNYSESEPSDYIGSMYTTLVKVSYNTDTIESASVNDKEQTILLNGEAASVSGATKTGYILNTDPWTANGFDLSEVKINADQNGTTATVKPVLSASTLDSVILLSAGDEDPWIEEFAGNNCTDDQYQSVNLSIHAHDTKGITAYYIGSTPELPENPSWIVFDEAFTGNEFTHKVDAAGTYYVFVKDENDNIASFEKSVVVVKLDFAKGDDLAEGSMTSILAVKGSEITIPEKQYTLEGHAFKNWMTSAGYYDDQATYPVTKADTFTACWTAEQYRYKVNYYRQKDTDKLGEDRTYELYKTINFSASYGDVLSTDDVMYALASNGFTRCLDADKNISITISEQNQELDIYYNRNIRTVTFTYTEPDGTVFNDSQEFYFGADMAETFGLSGKPEVEGYSFIGWVNVDNSAAPSKMPDKDIVVTGKFEPNDTKYYINVYLQNISDDGYTAASTFALDAKRSRVLGGLCGYSFNVSSADFDAIDGFTFAGISVTKGVAGGTAYPSDAADTKTVTVDIPAKAANINVYYTRNVYTLTLNVWKGSVGVNKVYTHAKDIIFGGKVDAELVENYEKDTWANISDDYMLSDTIDWSTGERITEMPAGNVTVTRQLISTTTGQYLLEFYLETDVFDQYTKVETLKYVAPVGSVIDLSDENTYNNAYYQDRFASEITNLKYCSYAVVDNSEGKGTVLTGTVTDTDLGAEPLVLRVYFKRNAVPVTFNYYYNNGKMGSNLVYAVVKKDVVWGHTYNVEPLAFFNTVEGGSFIEDVTSVTFERTIDDPALGVTGVAADTFDFLNANYVVGYNTHAVLNKADKWGSNDFKTIASLSGNYTFTAGQTSNTVSVYYTKSDILTMPRLEIGYNDGNLIHNPNGIWKNITYEYNGKDYPVWVANEAYFYNNVSYLPDESFAAYPGLGMKNLNNKAANEEGTTGRFIYDTDDSNLKDGFTKLSINGKTYYSDGERIYISLPGNNLFKGNFTSYSYNVNGGADEIGSQVIVDFMKDYKEKWANDVIAQTIHVYNRSYGSGVILSDTKLTVSFRETYDPDEVVLTNEGPMYRLIYVLNGAFCKNNDHLYLYNTNITDFTCEHAVFDVRPGYHVAWYTDSDLTIPVTPFNIGKNVRLYGQYERDIITNTVYSYYELKDYISIDGVEYSYITENELAALMAAFPGSVSEIHSTKTNSVTDDANNVISVTTDVITYQFEGETILVKSGYPTLTFREISVDSDDYLIKDLTYEEKNAGNFTKTYVESDPVDLKIYYIRDKYEAIVETLVPNSNPEIVEYRAGQTIVLPVPEQGGYTFDHWSFSKKNNDGYVAWDDVETSDTDGVVSFAMPDSDVKVTAVWKAAEFEQSIWHYFQKADKSYDSGVEAEMTNGTAASIVYAGTTYAGFTYGGGKVSFTNNNNTYYFKTSTFENNTYKVMEEDLSAISQKVTILQDADTSVSDNVKSIKGYSFADTVYRYKNYPVETLYAGDSYINRYEMVVEYFYTLESFDVTLDWYPLSGEKGTVTLMGADTYTYGEDVTITAIIPAGYKFLGWFKESEVSDKPSENLPTPVADTETFVFRITSNVNYVAIVEADEVSKPIISTSEGGEFVYGSEEANSFNMSVNASFPDGASSADYVASYQWYVNGEAITTNGKSAVYVLPKNLKVGEYQYTCEVTVANRDNGLRRIITTEEPIEVKIVKADITVETTDVDVVYDAEGHNIDIKVTAPENFTEYEIYYSNEKLTADNYTSASKDAPSYVNVCTEDGKDSYDVYYYVASTNPNYKDTFGHGVVKITPKEVTLLSSEFTYHKTYDGTSKVNGDDLYELTHGNGTFFTISGLLPSDSAEAYIISCEAEFDSAHVLEANVVFLSDVVLAYEATGEVLSNYYFNNQTVKTFSGYIEMLTLDIAWDQDSYVFDGNVHCPVPSITTEIPSVDKDNLSLVVEGAQIYTGTYNASASMKSSSEATKTSDFSLAGASKSFKITPNTITVKMESITDVTYDGEEHTLTDCVIVSGSVADKYTVVADADASYKDAGTYHITPANVRVLNENGVDMSANYTILTDDSGILTIAPLTITVTDIASVDKDYDGTTDAEIDLSGVTFVGMVSEDELSLDPSKVHGNFTDSVSGQDKVVTITYDEAALIGSSAGNYILDTVNSQSDTTATINQLKLLVTPVDVDESVYGEDATFNVTYSNFLPGETIDDITIAGTPTFLVGKDLESAVPFDSKLPVGTYNIYVDVTGLSTDNYGFEAGVGTLVIAKRKIAVTASDRTEEKPYVTKPYDGKDTVSVTLTEGEDYYFTSVAGDSASGVLAGDSVELTYSLAAYTSVNAGTPDIKVNGLTISNDNYELVTTEFTVPGEITKVKLTAKPKALKVTYGNTTVPPYAVTYSGFVNNEGTSVISGTISYDCEYDVTNPSKRNVNKYTITSVVDGLSAENYYFEAAENILTVEPAKITIKPVPSESAVTYGKNQIPSFTYTYSALAYGENFADVITENSTLTYRHSLTETSVGGSMVVSSIPGDYKVRPNLTVGGANVFTAANGNYTFVEGENTVTVNKYALNIYGIKVLDKTYDGNNVVPADKFDLTNLTLDGLLPIDEEYFAENPSEAKIIVSGTFADKNVVYNGSEVAKQEITLTVSPAEYLAKRCIFNAEDEANQNSYSDAKILPRPLNVTAKDTSIYYNSDISKFTYDVSFDPVDGIVASGLVTGEAPTKANVTFGTTYTNLTAVGIYSEEIFVSDLTDQGAFLAKNYVPNYIYGEYEVIQNFLDAPVAVWDANDPGVITYTEVNGLGDVSVEEYVLILKRNGTAVTGGKVVIKAGEESKHSYKELMRASGAGVYTVDIQAIASEVNNVDHQNVSDSSVSTSGKWYAANVLFKPLAGHAITDAGTLDQAFFVNTSENSYVVIAGETDIPIKTSLVNATGYTIDSITTNNANLTIATKTDAARTDASIETTVSLKNTHQSSADIVVTLKLAARKATLDVTVSRVDDSEVIYGYGTAPEFKATATTVSDNITTSGYKYTYYWEYREGKATTTLAAIESAEDTNVWAFPLGKRASNAEDYYRIRCTVVAERLDNGETTTYTKSWELTKSFVTNLIINRATFTYKVAIDDWTYGEAQKIPSWYELMVPANDLTDMELWVNNTIEYSYSEDGVNWTTTKPSDAGEYYIRAYVPKSTNFNEYQTPDNVMFTIAKGKFVFPDGATVTHAPSATAGYGTFSWPEIITPKRNATGTPVPYTYTVVLEKSDGGEFTTVKTFENLTETTLDVTEYLTLGNRYKVTITGISGDAKNCMDSDPLTSQSILIGVDLTLSDNEAAVDNGGYSYERTYDGNDIVLSASHTGEASAYQWYKDGQELSGETSKELVLTHVKDSGLYTCAVTIDGEVVYTPIETIKINKRVIKLTSDSDEKVYDGTPLTNHNVQISDPKFANGANGQEGVTFTFDATATITNKGIKSKGNKFTYTYLANTSADDYTISVEYGTLEITARPLSEAEFSIADVSDVVYKDSAYTPTPAVTDNGLATGSAYVMVSGAAKDLVYSYTNNVNAGTATITITGKNNYSGTLTKTFTIKQRPISFNGIAESKEYNNTVHTINGVNIDNGTDKGLVNGHTHNVTFTASGKEVDVYTGTITAKDDVVIMRGSENVTANYIVETTTADLTVYKTNASWSISLADYVTTYNGLPQNSDKVPTSTALSGVTTYQYSLDNENFVSELSTLKKTDASETGYILYVKATNPNYEAEATCTAKLIINRAELVVKTESASKPYDSNELTADGDIDGLQNNETIGFATNGTITEFGKVYNTYEITWAMDDNDFTAKESNYYVTEDIGTLEITEREIVVSITGNNRTETFDRNEYSVSDFTFVTDEAEDSKLYTLSDMTYSGNLTISRTEHGTTNMELDAAKFTNTNVNFSVTFEIAADGYVTIEKYAEPIIVTITGKYDTKIYNGSAQSVSGYDYVINDALFHVDDFKLKVNGSDSVSGTDADTYYMGLIATSFENLNDNFSNVTFDVTDGYIIINPITDKVTVTIIGTNDTSVYDGTMHTVEHYTWSADNDLYVREFFTFAGTESASRKDVGTTMMELDGKLSDDTLKFKNATVNFTDVVFDITDGYQTITERKISFTAKSETKTYNGTEQSINTVKIGELKLANNHTTNVTFLAKGTEVGNYVGTITAKDSIKIYDAENQDVTDNYQITEVVNGSLTIEKSNVDWEITLSDYTVDSYDGNAHANMNTAISKALSGTTTFSYSFEENGTYVSELTSLKKTEAGEYTIYVKATNPNYEKTATTTAKLIIKKRVITVTITGNSDSVTYDGNKHSVSGYTWESSEASDDKLYKEEDMSFSGNAEITDEVYADTYQMGLTKEMFENLNDNFDVTYVVNDGSLTIGKKTIKVSVTGNTASYVYNGSEQSVTGYTWVSDEAEGEKLYTDTDFGFTGNDTIAKTDVSTTNMGLTKDDFSNANDNFDVTFEVVSDGKLTITPLAITVTITGTQVTETYNGNTIESDGFDWSTDEENPLYTEDDFTHNASHIIQKVNAGQYYMNLNKDDFENHNDNFTVNFVIGEDGSLLIEKLAVTVTINGHTSYDNIYNGNEQEVSGYEFEPSDALYTEDDFTFAGNTTIKGTNVGTYQMQLSADDFTNINDNFTVTFTISKDGEIEIVEREITVTIIGHKDTVTYDGQAHTVEGYDCSIEDTLYTEDDFTFNGTAEITKTDVDTYVCELRDTDFENLNTNFIVNFVIEENCELVIEPKTVKVMIVGNTLSVTYDGENHTIDGYVWSTDEADGEKLYTEDDFEFSGNIELTESDVDKYEMGLVIDMFTNINDNFDVTFEITSDGYLEITKKAIVVSITGNNATHTYSSEDYTVDGFTWETDEAEGEKLYTENDFSYSGITTITESDAGQYTMDLDADLFSNANENFTVTFEIAADGWLKINKKEITVTITGNNDTVTYDADEHTLSGYEWTSDEAEGEKLYTENDFSYNGNSDSITKTDAGSYTMGLVATDFENLNDNFSVTFEIKEDGELTILKKEITVTIIGNTDSWIYDGQSHTVSGYTFETDESDDDKDYVQADITFAGTSNATQTDSGKTMMNIDITKFSNTNDNFEVTFELVDGYSEVTPYEDEVIVTITGTQEEKVYNGQTQTVSGWDYVTDTDLFDAYGSVSLNGTAEASAKDKGASYMNLTEDMFVNDAALNFTNVTFVVEDGYIEITPVTETVTVTITGNTDSKVYTGNTESVSGYTVEISNPLYKESYFTFSGTAEASGTDIETYYMNLTENDFANISENFASVEFVVTDGYITITPYTETVIVTVTGNHEVVTYNGEEHIVEGYVLSANNSLYDTNNVAFDGTALVTGFNAGTGMMGLTEDMFTNMDDNFAQVTFEIVDGYLTIDPVTEEVVVTITGASETTTYDGSEHSIEGYDFSASNPLYLEEFLQFNGTAYAEQLHVGKNLMGLPGQFENISENFTHVVFEVTDGYMEITPAAVTIEVSEANKVYKDEDPQFTGTVNGLFGDDELSELTYYRTNDAENAGTYTGVITASFEENPDYTVTVINADFTIYPADSLYIDVITDSFVYDGEMHAAEFTVSNENDADGADNTIYYSTDGGETWTTDVNAASIKNVADSKTISIKVVNPNYLDVIVSCDLTITPAEAVATAVNGSKIYGDEDDELIVSVEGLYGDDTIDYIVYRDGGETVGVYTVYVGGMENQDNYTVTFENGSFEILPRPVILAWDFESFDYDGEEKHVIPTITNKKEWPAFSFFMLMALAEEPDDEPENNAPVVPPVTGNFDDVEIGLVENDTFTNAGTYQAKVLTLIGEDAENYTLLGATNATWDWEIRRAKVTLTADYKNSVVNRDLKELTYTMTEGQLYGEDILGEVTISCEVDNTVIGSYPIELAITEGTENSNYDITLVPGTYEIKAYNPNQPATGDTELPFVWMLLSMMGGFVVFLARRKKEQEM